MNQKAKYLLIFGVAFGVLFWADLWTKDWADTNLADRRHPLPVQVADTDEGKSLSQVLQARFEWDAATAAERLAAGHIQKLEPAGVFTGSDAPFASNGPAARARGFYVFWRDDPTLPPRLIHKNELTEVSRWAQFGAPNANTATIHELSRTLLDSLTFADWLPERFRKLNSELVTEIAASRIHPITRTTVGTRDTIVTKGETWLLTHEQVTVSGDWFKFVYAENPGAAFGFLKGVSVNTRLSIFGGLTIIAFLVILILVWRLPLGAWWVYAGLGAVLSGAAGNFVDRMRYTYVIDFLDMDLGFMHWPTFNVADIAIAIGVIAMIIDILFNKDSPLVSAKDKQRRIDRIAEKAARKAAKTNS